MQIVIMAGGLATGLGELSSGVPKSMIRINGKPFLQYQIELLRENGIKNILLCVGHLGEQIKDFFGSGEKFGVSIIYSEDGEKLLGTGGALKKAEQLIEDKFVLMWGDSYLLINYQDVWKKFQEQNYEGLMVVYKNFNSKAKSNVIVKDRMVSLYDKYSLREEMNYIDYGLSAFKKTILNRIPKDKIFAIETVFNKLSTKGQLVAYEADHCFFEIGSISGLREFEEFVFKQNVTIV